MHFRLSLISDIKTMRIVIEIVLRIVIEMRIVLWNQALIGKKDLT